MELPNLPEPFRARTPVPQDVPALVDLIQRSREHIGSTYPVDTDAIRSQAVGLGSWTRHQCVVLAGDRVVAWAAVHDRAAGRADLTLVVDRDLPQAAALADALLTWLEDHAITLARERHRTETRLEVLADEQDAELHAWLQDHGHHQTREWWNMSRPLQAPGEPASPRPGVRIRRVATHDVAGDVLPVAEDLRTVHRMLEESFADHFNSYRESFPEFVQRLREDPGHRWDHWWLAFVETDDGERPGGALVGSERPRGEGEAPASYIDYIGVHRDARGRGVAKALLATAVADAAERGRTRIDLEVDADSPTGAAGLYQSLGWARSSATHSLQKDLRWD